MNKQITRKHNIEYSKEIKSIVKDTFLYSNNLTNNKQHNTYLFIFSYRRNIYRIPYNEINYIEKESNIKRCIIHTIKDDYYISLPITKLEEILINSFVKTHQSCIINTNNIKEITKNEIKFYNDDKTNLINKNMRNKIIDLLELKEH